MKNTAIIYLHTIFMSGELWITYFVLRIISYSIRKCLSISKKKTTVIL